MKITVPAKPDFQSMVRVAAELLGNATVLKALCGSLTSSPVQLETSGEPGNKHYFSLPIPTGNRNELVGGSKNLEALARGFLDALAVAVSANEYEHKRLEAFAKENGYEIV